MARRGPRWVLALGVILGGAAPAAGGVLQEKAFTPPELYLPTTSVDARTLDPGLAARPAWNRFFATYGAQTPVFVDPTSGTATNLIVSVPLIPGTGAGDHVGASAAAAVDADTVGARVRQFVIANREVLGIDPEQLGPVRAAQVTDELWQVSIAQVVLGIPVRDARIVATLSHGNLVLLGTEKWAKATLDAKPTLSAERALAAGFEAVGGRGCKDRLWKDPALEIVSLAGDNGYVHRLVWAFGFRRASEIETWETLVDAHDGRLLAFQDTTLHATREISGGVYPSTSTGVCASNERCGVLQPDWPMPFADTGLAVPNNFTNGAGVYDLPDFAMTTTTLSGRYVKIDNTCGTLLEASESGNLDLGGADGQHECTSAGSAGNTAAARTAFYHLNKLSESARGWLPTNAWANGQITARLNYPGLGACGGLYLPDDSSMIWIPGQSGQCRNTAEIAGSLAHEWGHGLDYHDAIGLPTVSTESYADIAAMLGSQSSCPAYGFLTADQGCGATADGTGMNGNEATLPGVQHCLLDCSGKRDGDWDRHADHTPDTPQGFVCGSCAGPGTGIAPGPCGRDRHCDGRPAVEAVWDLAARDLQAAPFGLSRTDAFVVTTKLFMQGSGNIGNWHACNCGAGTADGCAAANAYMQWLAADDDNGNLTDGTPHMSALFAAFNRHRIACNVPTPQNSGCASGPATAPTLVATAGGSQVQLSWSSVPGAVRYRVLRAEGLTGCDGGKAVIAETTQLSYTDAGLKNDRNYSYVVHAVGASGACFGPGSACQSATPLQCAGALVLSRNRFACGDGLQFTLEDSDLRGAGSQPVSVSSTIETAPTILNLIESPAGSGRFVGALGTTTAPPAGGDGAISVTHGATLTARYVDASRCGTPNVTALANAQADCQGPAFSNVHVTDLRGTRAEVRWDTSEPAQTLLSYGTTLPPAQAVTPDTTLVTSHLVTLTGLQTCTDYHFGLGAIDRLGNQSSANNGGSFFAFETPAETKPIYSAPGLPLPVPLDNAWPGTVATIQVPDAEAIDDLNVRVRVPEVFTHYVTLTLTAPDYTQVVLSDRRGTGQGYDEVLFDDGAELAIIDEESPFYGSYRPEQPLSALTGKLAAGTWRLHATNSNHDFGAGTLDAFDLELIYPPRACGPAVGRQSESLADACSGSAAGHANGLMEPGETVQLAVQVHNADTSAVTGLSARLWSHTPGVFVTSATTTYSDLAPGASAVGVAPFELYVEPSVPCGTPAVLRLDGTSGQGGWSTTFTVVVGQQVPDATSYFNNTVRSLPDLTTTRSFIAVADPWIVTDVDVSFTIDHIAPADMDVFLVSPDGTRVELTTDNGGSNGTGYTDTVFDDEAAAPITSGGSPFTGHYRPESPLSALDGLLATGSWTLEVTDDRQSVVGTLRRWSLVLGHLTVPPCATCPLTDPPTEVTSLAWAGPEKDTLTWSATPRAASYTLHRGLPADLPALLDAGVDSCARVQTAQLGSGPVLTETPAQGSYFWFLVRAENGIGSGPIGNATAGARVANASGACP